MRNFELTPFLTTFPAAGEYPVNNIGVSKPFTHCPKSDSQPYAFTIFCAAFACL